MSDIYNKLSTLAETDTFLCEFNDYLESIGLRNARAQYNGVSHVDVYLRSDRETRKAGRVLRRKADAVIDTFFELARRHQLDMDGYAARKNWNNNSFSARSLESACINAVMHASKEEIIAALKAEFGTAPKYIFCHSEKSLLWPCKTAYYFYFENQEADYVALCKKPKTAVRELCNRVVRWNDPSGYCRKHKMSIQYLNRDEPPEYGFWRED